MSARSSREGRVFHPTSSCVAKWRALAEYALLVGQGRAKSMIRLRELRDETNTAIVMGAEGEGNICRRLVETVCDRTDPRYDGEALIDRELTRLADEVLRRCDVERQMIQAKRWAR